MTKEKQLRFSVAFGKQPLELQLPEGATLKQLGSTLSGHFDVAPHTIKLFLPGGKGGLKLPDQDSLTLQDVGIQNGARIKMLGSRSADVAAVQAAHDDKTIPGFDHELQRELHRSTAAPRDVQPPAGLFKRFEAWQRPGLSPPPSEALKLLHRLAADPGIVGVMRKHAWTVGVLSEMPPEGKVGVSPVCILGVNINKGQEISLRLRTDDLRGFRRYDRIRETLLHELAHMVWGDHDDNFKQLNSQVQLRRECAALDWRGAAARSLAGPVFGGTLDYQLPLEQQTAASSGRKLGTADGGAAAAPADARQAAAQAALRRAQELGAERGPSGARPLPEQPSAAQGDFCKGQVVLYRNRDGSWQEAKIAAVDQSVRPFSYGIEIDGNYRETEGSRLAPLPRPEEVVEGLGHQDAATEAKEAAVQQMER